jgi:uncharacterized protein
MTSLAFLDINVWLALSFSRHAHHEVANEWFASLDEDTELVFCRFTQMGFLRLVTTASVMGADVKTQRQAWRLYDDLIRNSVRFVEEPKTLEDSFRAFAKLNSASPKDWADSYLAAFAEEVGATLVTFDRVLSLRAKGSVLLKTSR